MELLIEDIKTYFAIDKEDKALQVEKLIELLYTPIATYIDEDVVDLILDEDSQADGNFIDDIIDNYLDIIETNNNSVEAGDELLTVVH